MLVSSEGGELFLQEVLLGVSVEEVPGHGEQAGEELVDVRAEELLCVEDGLVLRVGAPLGSRRSE